MTSSNPNSVIPAKAGIHHLAVTLEQILPISNYQKKREMDSRFRGNDARGKHALQFAIIALLSFTTQISHAQSPQLDPRFCQQLVTHTPDADVTYQPGVDVHGKAVAPADLPGSPQVKLPDVITIPVTVDLFSMLHLNRSNRPFKPGSDTYADLGTIAVEGNRVTYNGQPLSSEQQENLSVLCMHPDGRALPPPVDLKPQTPQ